MRSANPTSANYQTIDGAVLIRGPQLAPAQGREAFLTAQPWPDVADSRRSHRRSIRSGGLQHAQCRWRARVAPGRLKASYGWLA